MKLSEAAFLIQHNDDIRGKQELIRADALHQCDYMNTLLAAIIGGKEIEILTLDEAIDKFLENHS